MLFRFFFAFGWNIPLAPFARGRFFSGKNEGGRRKNEGGRTPATPYLLMHNTLSCGDRNVCTLA